jgi:hypothetical protein
MGAELEDKVLYICRTYEGFDKEDMIWKMRKLWCDYGFLSAMDFVVGLVCQVLRDPGTHKVRRPSAPAPASPEYVPETPPSSPELMTQDPFVAQTQEIELPTYDSETEDVQKTANWYMYGNKYRKHSDKDKTYGSQRALRQLMHKISRPPPCPPPRPRKPDAVKRLKFE